MDKQKIAKWLSIILGAQVWFPILILLFIFKTGLTQQQILILFPSLILFQIILPVVVLYWLIKSKRVSDWDIRNRKERYKILPVFIASTLVATIIIHQFGTELFFHLYVILWIAAFIGTLMTYFFKISLHVMLNTAAVTVVNFLFGWNLLFLYLLIPIVSWARYYHKHHTIVQILLGILISAIIVFSALAFLGYI